MAGTRMGIYERILQSFANADVGIANSASISMFLSLSSTESSSKRVRTGCIELFCISTTGIHRELNLVERFIVGTNY